MAEKCSSVKKDGSPCLNQKVRGMEFCFYHLPPDIRRTFRKKPLSKEELAIILGKEIRLARRIKDPAERAKRIQNLATLLMQLESGQKTTDNPTLDPIEAIVKKWKDSQIS